MLDKLIIAVLQQREQHKQSKSPTKGLVADDKKEKAL